MAGSRAKITTISKAFKSACALYEEMATALTAEIMRLRQEEKHRPLEKDEIALIRSHQKTVLMVLDFETKLLKSRVHAQREAGGGIDLAAARAEIASRLDRLAAAG